MPYNALAVANYFLDLAERKCLPLDQMKLQKLIYFAHGWHLALMDKPLLDELVQAWSFGPVVRSVYNEFREFGANSIKGKAWDVVRNPGTQKWMTWIPSLEDSPQEDLSETKELLDRVWDVYKEYTGVQLSNLTHERGTPWDTINKQFGGQIPKYATIPDEIIKRYFKDARSQG